MPRRRPTRWVVLGLGAALLVTSCGRTGGGGSATATAAPPDATPMTTPSASASAAAVASLAAPPMATLAVEGGEPVAGDLGSYTWGESGSDAPWLPGEPIRVGRGETLTLALEPAVPVESWAVRYVPVGAAGPDAAESLATGAGDPVFPVPPLGAWSTEVAITFADGQGDARWFWEIHVE